MEEFYRRIRSRIGEARKLAEAANRIEAAMGRSRAWADRARGSRWAGVTANKGLFRVIPGVLPDEIPDREYLPAVAEE
ncbi:hypothetical protein [Anaeromyxobacter soli]|uniref:hypothetical protein n=1 Tax=Anaeromyxobacter soli TaxID=2922725 RepID=UPI001FAEF429|nr:hypothetical protein [Anaeromyxobacter sp. SG29]